MIRRYIAGEQSPAAVDIAELLVLIDADAAAMVDDASDAIAADRTVHGRIDAT